MDLRKATLVGRGRLGRVLQNALPQCNIPLEFFRGRSPNESIKNSDLLLCIPDAIPDWVDALKNFSPHSLTLFSGSVQLEGIEDVLPRTQVGRLHPLSSFTNQENMPKGLTFAVSGPENLVSTYRAWVSVWEGTAFELSDEDAETYHLAAVLASNFLPLWVRVGARYMSQVKHMDSPLKALQPLVEQALAHALDENQKFPYSGPAARGDKALIQKYTHRLNREDPKLGALFAEICHIVQSEKDKLN